jgi:hypothetical protein
MTVYEPAGGRRHDGSRRAEQTHRHACHPSYRVPRIIDRGPRGQERQEERGPVSHRDGCRKKAAVVWSLSLEGLGGVARES